jgi:hypothetical protein
MSADEKRLRFEEWAGKRYISLRYDPQTEYADAQTQDAWDAFEAGWQAAQPDAQTQDAWDAFEAGWQAAQPTPLKPRIYKHPDAPANCPECDSTCFITAGGSNLVCYHCHLVSLIPTPSKLEEIARKIAELYGCDRGVMAILRKGFEK